MPLNHLTTAAKSQLFQCMVQIERKSSSTRSWPIVADCRWLMLRSRASGLFTVNKSSHLDRLILDARPPNLLEKPKSFWCGTMGYASGLGDIHLEEQEVLCCSGLDLKDFLNQFRVGPQRIERNVLAGSLTYEQAVEIFGEAAVSQSRSEKIRVALATLAMGDLLACEFSQSAHLSLCLRHGVMSPGELLTLRTPVPRSKVIAGVIIDDLVIMERLLREELAVRGNKVEDACDRIGAAINGYARTLASIPSTSGSSAMVKRLT